MTREYEINIQPGHVARHTPRNAGAQGREAAVVDIAQDLLLRWLHDEGLLNGVAIKGGTAIRKLYAGNEGRFSLDLDFAVAEVGQDRDEAALSFATAVDGLRVGPFGYGVRERRGEVVSNVLQQVRGGVDAGDQTRLLARALARARA